MALECNQVGFMPPDGFRVDEVMYSMSLPATLRETRAVQRQVQVRPNLIIHRRRVSSSARLETLVGEVAAELATSIVGMEHMTTEQRGFDDGSDGIVITFDYATRGLRVRQYNAMRLDGEIFTTATLTVDLATSNEAARTGQVACLFAVTANGALDL